MEAVGQELSAASAVLQRERDDHEALRKQYDALADSVDTLRGENAQLQLRLGQAASEQQRLLREQSVADASAKDLQKQVRG